MNLSLRICRYWLFVLNDHLVGLKAQYLYLKHVLVRYVQTYHFERLAMLSFINWMEFYKLDGLDIMLNDHLCS